MFNKKKLSAVDFGKKWRADSVDVTDGTDENYTYRLQRQLRYRLEEALWEKESFAGKDAVVISYWWD